MTKQYITPETVLLKSNTPYLLAGSPTVTDKPSDTGEWNLSKRGFSNLIEDDAEDIY